MLSYGKKSPSYLNSYKTSSLLRKEPPKKLNLSSVTNTEQSAKIINPEVNIFTTDSASMAHIAPAFLTLESEGPSHREESSLIEAL